MKSIRKTKVIAGAVTALVCTFALFYSANAEVIINARPLTPQNITDYGITGTTQTANGLFNVGVGQPMYLEAFVNITEVVQNVSWNLVSQPSSSVVALATSPLGTNVPTYNHGDREDYQVAGRTMLKPDVAGVYGVTVQVDLDTGTEYATNLNLAGSGYLGVEHYLCVLCHAAQTGSFAQTDHATAFKNQINGQGSDHFASYCIGCHVLGYDTDPGATNGGWDDVAADTGWTFPATLATNNWDDMPAALRSKSNIQCENCHGAASTHLYGLGDTNFMGVSISAGNCGQCHDKQTHHVRNFEWEQSRHATGYVFRVGCENCHSAKDYIETFDPDWAGREMLEATGNEGITCAACHDPHVVGDGPHQLRVVPDPVLADTVTVVTNAGAGAVCMQCHRGRRDAPTYVQSYHSRFGPHHGPQTDMLVGSNAWTYGLNLPSSRHGDVVEDTCAGCHMVEIEGTSFDFAHTYAGGHTFRLMYHNMTEDPNDDIAITEACASCHGGITSFDFGGEDYDKDGMVEGVQSEIAGLLDKLGRLLPPYDDPEVSVTSGYTAKELKAAFNYLFVEEDKSHGVHNPKFAASLLQVSIMDLTTGIDFDCDGLLDAWEMSEFGNLTSQSGDDDPDGDGLTNAQEQELGTDPNEPDSDNDGISDKAELEGMTDPNDIGDFPTTNRLIIASAFEVKMLPGDVGTTNQVQIMDKIEGTTWMDHGDSYVSDGNWHSSFMSPGDSTSYYFRVIQP